MTSPFGKTTEVFSIVSLSHSKTIEEAKGYINTYFIRCGPGNYLYFSPTVRGEEKRENYTIIEMNTSRIRSTFKTVMTFTKEEEDEDDANDDDDEKRKKKKHIKFKPIEYIQTESPYDAIIVSNPYKPFTFTLEDNKTLIFINRAYSQFYDLYQESLRGILKHSEDFDIIMDHIKYILCSKNEEQFNYFINWLANIIHGHKNRTDLYIVASQGLGKSIIIQDFLMDKVFKGASIKADPKELISEFNIRFEGKILCVFEDPTSTKDEWRQFSTKLRDDTTSKMISYGQKFRDIREGRNYLNFIIISNEQVIKLNEVSGDRRIVMLDVSTSKMDNKEYYTRLAKAVNNNETAKEFLHYLAEIDISNFNEDIIPQSQTRKDCYADRRDLLWNYIIEDYIRPRKDIGHPEIQDEFEKGMLFSDFQQDLFRQKNENISMIQTKKPERIKYSAFKIRQRFEELGLGNAIYTTNVPPEEAKKFNVKHTTRKLICISYKTILNRLKIKQMISDLDDIDEDDEEDEDEEKKE